MVWARSAQTLVLTHPVDEHSWHPLLMHGSATCPASSRCFLLMSLVDAVQGKWLSAGLWAPFRICWACLLPSFRPKSCSQSKISGRILQQVREPFLLNRVGLWSESARISCLGLRVSISLFCYISIPLCCALFYHLSLSCALSLSHIYCSLFVLF